MTHPAPLKPFTLTCLWYGLDGALVWARSGREALAKFAREKGLTLWGETHYPAEGPDWVAQWGAAFQGQTWPNGDYNIESVSVYEAEPEDVALPC